MSKIEKSGKLKNEREDSPKETSKRSQKVVKAAAVANFKSNKLDATYTTTANLNMRHGPGIENQTIITIPKGSKVRCYGYYTKVPGSKWLYVESVIKNVKYIGFCPQNYLRELGGV